MELMYIRVRTFFHDGKSTGCDHIYLTTSQAKALERFRNEYPEHNGFTAMAERFYPEKNPSLFEAFKRCECVHFW